jgi:hypothetical protein
VIVLELSKEVSKMLMELRVLKQEFAMLMIHGEVE